MNILHICPSFNNPLYANLCDNLIKLNANCSVYSFVSKKSKLKIVERDYCITKRPFTNIDRYLFFLKEKKIYNELLQTYDVSDYDLVHAHTLFVSGYVAYKVYEKYNVPYVVAVRSTDVDMFFKYRILLRTIGKSILKNASKIIFISPSIKNRLFNLYLSEKEKRCIESKSVVVPNGIDDFWFNKGVSKSNHNYSFIYYGDINKNKNIINSCKALELLSKEQHKIKFTVIGPIKDEKLIKKIKKYDFVECYNAQPKENIIKELNKASVFIMPSFRETFGLSYVEAMSQGLPIIYSCDQGPDGYFNNKKVGYSVNPFSPYDIYNKIKMIFDDFLSISHNCIEEAQQFRWNDIALKYFDIYLGVFENEVCRK